jgi:hypothetical protein
MSPRKSRSGLSSPGAIKLGLIFASFGHFSLISATGLIHTMTDDSPNVLCLGLGAVLALGGIVLILRGAGGVDRDPFRSSGAEFAVRMAEGVVVLAAVAVLTYVIIYWRPLDRVPRVDDSYVTDFAQPSSASPVRGDF